MIFYISEYAKRFVNRNNGISTKPVKIFNHTQDVLEVAIINKDNQIISPPSGNLYLAGSFVKKNSKNLLFMTTDYEIDDKTIKFNYSTNTYQFLDLIKGDDVEIRLEIGVINGENQQVILSDYAFASQRYYIQGMPAPDDLASYYTKTEITAILQNYVLLDSFIAHVEDTDIHTNAEEKAEWNAKQNAITEDNKLDFALLSGVPSLEGAQWGAISGDINAQTDLMQKLNDKADICSISKKADYLYYVETSTIDYEYAKQHLRPLSGACSSVRRGRYFYRNFDWIYSNADEFVVKTPNTIGIACALAKTADEIDKRMLPFYIVDGINSKGLVANINVCEPNSANETVPAIEERDEIPAEMLVRYILDNFDNAQTALEYIRDYVKVTFKPDFGYSVHIMAADSNGTFILEFDGQNAIVNEHEIMTNFKIDGVIFNADGKVYTPADVTLDPLKNPEIINGISPLGTGLERYNALVDGASIEDVYFTKAYDLVNGFYSDFAGLGGLTCGSSSTDYNASEEVQAAIARFANRSRDPESPNFGTWQTMHSVVYDLITHKLVVKVQENEEEFSYELPDYATKEDVANAISGKADISDIPTAVSQLENDADYQNATQVSTAITNAVSGKADTSYVDEELAKKQQLITEDAKLDYALLSGTPSIPSPEWGAITGTLSAQTDLKAELDKKVEIDALVSAFKYMNSAISGYNGTLQKDNEIWYWAPAQVTLASSTGVVEHTFSNGKGVLKFAAPVTTCNDWFRGTSITNVSLPDTVTSIGNGAFNNCSSLALAELPSGITSIKKEAFKNCYNLALTELPSGFTDWGVGVNDFSTFENCRNMALTKLPDGITWIPRAAFKGCTSLALTELPSGLTSIDGYINGNGGAFDGCTNLALTELPESLTNIGGAAFQGCTSLALTELPSGITSIGGSAFRGCTSLALTELPSGLTLIEDNAFNNCSNISITLIPENVTNIKYNAFAYCTGLTSLRFLNIVEFGMAYLRMVFKGCTNLRDIYVPWAEDEVEGAPWEAPNATIHYNSVN